VAKHGAYRGTSTVPADARGNCYDRAARKAWLLSPAAPFGGNGRTVPCYWCVRALTAETVEIDRWPVCGHAGGSYRRDKIVPACKSCNAGRCTRAAAPCRGGGQLGLDLVVKEVAHG